jgi:hypothetical protein
MGGVGIAHREKPEPNEDHENTKEGKHENRNVRPLSFLS